MEVAGTIEQVRRCVGSARAAGKIVGLVPTMGALHAGHFGLVDAAMASCGFVVVSIFVNPSQFGPNEDLRTYPRTPQEDLASCRKRRVDLVFMPAEEVMYPPGGGLTQVSVRKLPDNLCGRSRPGHFTGVCTVVAKLFNIVQPDKAFFGAKDFQQAAIIRRMAADLDFPIEIVVCPTVREADGLAMSSRNARLTGEQRRQAVALNHSLRLAEETILRDRPPTGKVIDAIRRHLAQAAPDGAIDYVEIVDPTELADAASTKGAVLVALAVKFGGTRLIDNILVQGPG